jgi:hypothetical protein
MKNISYSKIRFLWQHSPSAFQELILAKRHEGFNLRCSSNKCCGQVVGTAVSYLGGPQFDLLYIYTFMYSFHLSVYECISGYDFLNIMFQINV